MKGEKGGGDGRKVPPVRPLFSLYSIILSYLFICRNQVLHGLLYENGGGGLYLCEKISTFELTVFWFLSISDHFHIWMNARASHVTSIYIIMDLVYLFHLQGGCRLVNITYTDIVHNGYKNVTRRDVVTYMYLF